MQKTLAGIGLALLVAQPIQAQNRTEHSTLYGMNAVAGCVSSGIAAARSKKTSFGKACLLGATGSALGTASRHLVAHNERYAALSKIATPISAGLLENPALGKPLLANIRLDFGPLTLRVTNPAGHVSIKPLLEPLTTYEIASAIASKENFDWKTTKRTLQPTFTYHEPLGGGYTSGRVIHISNAFDGGKIESISYRSFPTYLERTVRSDYGQADRVLRHELTHAHQHNLAGAHLRAFSTVNKYAEKLERHFIDPSVILGTAATMPLMLGPYEKHFVEREAFSFSQHYRKRVVTTTRRTPTNQ